MICPIATATGKASEQSWGPRPGCEGDKGMGPRQRAGRERLEGQGDPELPVREAGDGAKSREEPVAGPEEGLGPQEREDVLGEPDRLQGPSFLPPGGGRTICAEPEEASTPPEPTAGGGGPEGANRDTLAGATPRTDTVLVSRGRPHTPGPALGLRSPPRLHTHRLQAGPGLKAVLPTFQTRHLSLGRHSDPSSGGRHPNPGQPCRGTSHEWTGLSSSGPCGPGAGLRLRHRVGLPGEEARAGAP